MIRTFNYRLYPTGKQSRQLETVLDRCRHLYNAALQERRGAYEKNGISISKYDQFKSLTEIRAFDEEWNSVSLQAMRSSIDRLDKSYKSFFRRCKSGEKPGYPRFKGKDRFNSFGIGRVEPNLELKRVRVPNLGCVKLGLYRPIKGEVLNTMIKKSCGKWYVAFQCHLGPAPPKIAVSKAVGIDLGLTSLLVTSSGEKIENPKYFKQGQNLLAARQKGQSAKCRGSRNRAKARLLVQKEYEHISNQRSDYFWKLSRKLVKENDLIAHEDLDVRGLINKDDNARAKSITDASWGKFIHCLSCKAEEAGATVVGVDPRGTSQVCSRCGSTVKKTLYARTHDCEACGLVLDRDHNAALNILRLGLSHVFGKNQRQESEISYFNVIH